MTMPQNNNDFEKECQEYLDNFKHHQKGKIFVRIARFMGIRQFFKLILFVGLFFILFTIALIVQLSGDFDGYLTNLNTDEKNVYSLKFYNQKTPPTPLKTPLEVNTKPNKIAMNESNIAIVDGNGRVRFWSNSCFLNLCSDKKNLNLIQTGKIIENLDNIIGVEISESYYHNYLALKSDGTVWAMGENEYGVINPNAQEFWFKNEKTGEEVFQFDTQTEFYPIEGLNDIVDMVVDDKNTYFLDKNGKIFTLGIDRTVADTHCISSHSNDVRHSLKSPTPLAGLDDIEKFGIVNIIADYPLLAISHSGKLYKINDPKETKDGKKPRELFFKEMDCPLSLIYSIEEINLNTHKKVVDISTNRFDFEYPYSILFDDGSLLFYGKKDEKTGELLSQNPNKNSKNFAPIIKLTTHSAYTANNEIIVWDDYSMSGCKSSEYCLHRIGKDFGSPHLLGDNIQLREFKTVNYGGHYGHNWGAMIDVKGDVWIWGYDHRKWIGGLDKKIEQGYKVNPKKQLITLRNTGVNVGN